MSFLRRARPDSSLTLGMTGVAKRFGATIAVDGVTLAVGPGEIVGLVGENGAGKTTLMRIAAGEIAADDGVIDRPARLGMVHQHFALAGELTVAENLALLDRAAFRFTSPRQLEREAHERIARSGIDLGGVGRAAGDLSIGERAKLELVKALSVDPQLLILDEPTSVLTPVEAEELFAVIRRFAAGGAAVVFISHKVREVLEIATRIVVMRRGAIVLDSPRAGMTAGSIAEAMVETVGAPVSSPAPARTKSALLLETPTLKIHRNEIVAVIGVAGNGQSELIDRVRALASSHRLAYIPEDRTRDALVAEMSIAENIALRSNRWSPRRANERASALIDLYRIRALGPEQKTASLSGGNQQKVILARELDGKPELIIAAEPTRGLDIASAQFVREELRKVVAAGAGLLLVTSDLDEAFELADTVHVIYRGQLSEPMAPQTAAANIGPLMAGLQ